MNPSRTAYTTSVVCHVLFMLAVGPFVLLYDKTTSLLWINQHHHPALDHLLYHLTRLPELALLIFVVVLAFFYERKHTLAVVLSLLICALSIYLFKQIIFPDFERPSVWIKAQHIHLHLLPNIDLHSHGSFPSGHTLAAFAALGMAGFLSRHQLVQCLFFLIACGIAYSRVYVCQHYLRDVYVGGLFGYFISLSLFLFFNNRLKTPYWNNPPFSKLHE